MMGKSANDIDLVSAYLDALREGFSEDVTPDSVRVICTPFKYETGASIEIAIWEDGGKLHISDRGGFMGALWYELGDFMFDRYLHAMVDIFEPIGGGINYRWGVYWMETSEETLGKDVMTLIDTLIDMQIHAGFWAAELGGALEEARVMDDLSGARDMANQLEWPEEEE